MTAASNSRIQSSTLEDDIDAFLALETISTYAPNNPEHSLPSITAVYQELRADQASVIRAQIAHDTARDNLIATEREFHQLMLGVKSQVRGQYGPNSNEVAALGLKKTSERRTPTRSSKSTPGTSGTLGAPETPTT